MQHYTTIEQSKKLVELGLNPDTADMHYPDYYFDGNAKGPCNTPYKGAIEDLFHVYINPKTKRLLPCWSLGALLELMPRNVQINSNHACVSVHITFIHNGVVTDSHHVENNTFLEAAYNMICWLLENNYIKKGE